MNAYRIPKFVPSSAKPNATWLILGPRRAGKTELLNNLLYHTRHGVDLAIGMTENEDTAEVFRKILPSRFVYTQGYNSAAADQFLALSKHLTEKHKVVNMTLIQDDLMADKAYLNTKTQASLHLNGRHYNTATWNTSQFAMCHGPKLRGNIDYVFALKCTNMADRKRLYEYYFGVFPSFRDFNRVFEQLTQNFSAMVIDKTSDNPTVEGCIRHYKADLPTPAFRLGRRIFWVLSDRIDSENNRKKKQLTQIPSTTKLIA